MDLTIENVHVTNWSKNPFLKLGTTNKGKLTAAIRYSRQMVGDACELLAQYEHARLVADVDPTMAVDYFGGHDAVRQALHKYFGILLPVPGQALPVGPHQQHVSTNVVTNQAQVGTILAKYKQIRDGIAGKFDIVVGRIFDGDDVKDGLGDAWSHIKKGKFAKAIKNIKFINEGTEGWVNPGGNQQRIHLNLDSIETVSEGKIARIIVHEASHKFANTDDVDLLSDGSSDGSGYKWDGLKFNARGYVGLDNNADSYAWAARLMWKRKRGLQSGI